MVSLFKQDKVGTFEYIYFLVMVIYMAQMTQTTARMVSYLGSPYFPFFLPIILTIVLLDRHWVKFDDKRLIRILLLFGLWVVLLFVHKTYYDASQYSYHFFLFYSVVIAYIHVQVFEKKMLILYENIMMKLSLLALVLWGISVIYPGSAAFFQSFPKGGYGTNLFYLYTWTDPIGTPTSVLNGIVRNAGCSWEPGRYAVMILLALYCNLVRVGVKFKGNTSGIILLLAMASTQSTTGYIGTIILYVFFILKRFEFKYVLALFIFIIPIGYQLSKLDFMQEKILEQTDMDYELSTFYEKMDYVNKVKRSNEYVSSLSRPQSIYFEIINIEHDPWLGYGMNSGRSYFSQRISGNYVLVGGILKIFGQFGIPLGIFLYFILYLSSARLGSEFKVRKGAFFITMIIISISYPVFTYPIFTAFWFYGLFRKEENLLVSVTEEGEEAVEEVTVENIDSQTKE